MMDSMGSVQVVYWNNNDIISDDVIIETDNELDDIVSKNKATILELYEKGLFTDEDGKISSANKMKILNIFGISEFEQYEDIREIHKAKAVKENLDIENKIDLLEIDDHKIHIEEHTKFLICDESANVSDENKEKLLNHIKKHKEFLLENLNNNKEKN